MNKPFEGNLLETLFAQVVLVEEANKRVEDIVQRVDEVVGGEDYMEFERRTR